MVSLWTKDLRTVARWPHGWPHGHRERVWRLRGGRVQQRTEARALEGIRPLSQEVRENREDVMSESVSERQRNVNIDG